MFKQLEVVLNRMNKVDRCLARYARMPNYWTIFWAQTDSIQWDHIIPISCPASALLWMSTVHCPKMVPNGHLEPTKCYIFVEEEAIFRWPLPKGIKKYLGVKY